MSDGSVGVREWARRAAFFVASLSAASCFLGSLRAVARLRISQPVMLGWTAMPLIFSVVGMLASLGPYIGPIWLSTGALFAVVVLGAWSLGLFYAYTALLMFVAAIIHLVAVRAGWKTLLVPLWMLAGAGGLCGLLFLRDMLQSNGLVNVTHAPIVVWGSDGFVAASVLLALGYGLLRLRQPVA
jgi:hypothetical protein